MHRSRKNMPNLSWITLLRSRGGREKGLLWIWTQTPFQECQKYMKKFQNGQKPLRFFKQAADICLFFPPWFTQMSAWFSCLQKHLSFLAVPSQHDLHQTQLYLFSKLFPTQLCYPEALTCITDRFCLWSTPRNEIIHPVPNCCPSNLQPNPLLRPLPFIT